MIYFYKGARGRGKTLTMIKDAWIFHKNGYQVLSNMKSVKFATYISNEDILNINKDSPFKNCVILVDEIQTLFNARRSAKKENLQFSFFIQQIRKRNIELLVTSQFANTIDLILRQHLDFVVRPYFDKELKVCRVDYQDLNSIEEGTDGMIKPAEVVSVVYDAREIFGKYDTKELIV